jgi:hypothetical protein
VTMITDKSGVASQRPVNDGRYEQFPYDQVQQALTQMGVPPKGAALYIEMFETINAGILAPKRHGLRLFGGKNSESMETNFHAASSNRKIP